MQASSPNWRDYLELCKPRVVALMLLTAWVGMYLATRSDIPVMKMLIALTGIGLMASSAAIVNHLVDQRIDAVMWRTKRRPLPTGKIRPKQAILFATTLGLIGAVILYSRINALTALLTTLTLIGYAVVYTMYLKRATPQNIVIGGAAGAAPPLLGWTAMTGHIAPEALILVAIIFTWTPPHFWALAIHRHHEYREANIPMLPVTHGIEYTKLQILLYTCLLIACTLLPYAMGMAGLIYLIAVSCLNGYFLYRAVVLWLSKTHRGAYQTFKYSILYLMLLFLLLIFDHHFHSL